MQMLLVYDAAEIFLLRDFNMVPCPDLDSMHSVSRGTTDLVNWANNLPLQISGYLFTCHSATFKTLSRIKLAFTSASTLCWVRKAHILPRGISDHAPLCLTISHTTPWAPGCGISPSSGRWTTDCKSPLRLLNVIIRFPMGSHHLLWWCGTLLKLGLEVNISLRYPNKQKEMALLLDDLEAEATRLEAGYVVADPETAINF